MDNRVQISFGDADSVNIGSDTILSTSIVPVCSRRNGQLSGEGTAFCLARLTNGEAVFATAEHVIREIADRPEIEAFLLFRKDLVNMEDERSWTEVPIRRISYATANNDIALLVVTVSDFGLDVAELKWFPIKFGRPQVGQYCIGVGYPQEGKGSVNYDLWVSRGMIEEVHSNKRDTVLSTFPSFRTSALFKPAMSGGPIVGGDEGVIGIIAHGTEADDPELVTGYGSSIGAIGELSTRLHNEDGELQDVTVPHLVEMGVLKQADQAILRLDRDESGVTLTWDPPEMKRNP